MRDTRDEQAHYDLIHRPWTEPRLGQCSYLNTCFGDVSRRPPSLQYLRIASSLTHNIITLPSLPPHIIPIPDFRPFQLDRRITASIHQQPIIGHIRTFHPTRTRSRCRTRNKRRKTIQNRGHKTMQVLALPSLAPSFSIFGVRSGIIPKNEREGEG